MRLGAAISVSTNFESGSARVLAIDDATQTVRVSPAGDPTRGWPCWWYLRVDGIDATKALTLEVAASRATLPAFGPKPARALDPAWALPEQAAVSTNGIVWARTPDFERRGGMAIYRVPAGATTLWLAWGPPFTAERRGGVRSTRGGTTFVCHGVHFGPFARRPCGARAADRGGRQTRGTTPRHLDPGASACLGSGRDLGRDRFR